MTLAPDWLPQCRALCSKRLQLRRTPVLRFALSEIRLICTHYLSPEPGIFSWRPYDQEEKKSFQAKRHRYVEKNWNACFDALDNWSRTPAESRICSGRLLRSRRQPLSVRSPGRPPRTARMERTRAQGSPCRRVARTGSTRPRMAWTGSLGRSLPLRLPSRPLLRVLLLVIEVRAPHRLIASGCCLALTTLAQSLEPERSCRLYTEGETFTGRIDTPKFDATVSTVEQATRLPGPQAAS